MGRSMGKILDARERVRSGPLAQDLLVVPRSEHSTGERHMRVGITSLVAVAILTSPVGADAQADTTRSGIETAMESIFGSLGLPGAVTEARESGVADATIVEVLERMRRTGVSAADAEEILVQEVEVLRAGGPVGNFGAFVQSQLDAGLRGRALADAIRGEHRRMGIGIPEGRPSRDRAGPGRPGGRGAGADGGGGPARGGPPDAAPGGRGGRGPGGAP
jgi:hypothetical protein